MAEIPGEVRRLILEREERRRARDFAAADALRDRIAELGYEVRDTPEGPRAAPADATVARLRAEEVESVLDQPPRFDFSLQWVVQGWPEDAVRGIEAFRRHHPGRSVQYVVVDAAESPSDLWPPEVEVVALERDVGWGALRNAGLKRANGRVVLVVDGSVEPVGEVLETITRVLDDPAVGVCGPFGVVTDDLRTFREAGGPEVDAIEGYLMAFRREVLVQAGFFDEKFRFYRAADIDYSFRVKDQGLKALVVSVPLVRHEHRAWANTPEEVRERLSKRNFYRFLDRWRGRLDLCVGRSR